MEPDSTVTTNISRDGNEMFTSNVYIFNKPCDLSKLQGVNLANSTLHFSGSVNVKQLRALELQSANLIFNNVHPNTTLTNSAAGTPRKPAKVKKPLGPVEGRSVQKAPTKTKIKTENQRDKVQSKQGAPENDILSIKSDQELKASMESSITDIENAIHPDRIAFLMDKGPGEKVEPSPADISESPQTDTRKEGFPDRDADLDLRVVKQESSS